MTSFPSVSGPSRTISMLYTAYVAKLTRTPILSLGGFYKGTHVVEALMVGASAAGICTAVYREAGSCQRILEELKPLLEGNPLLLFRAASVCAALNERDQAFEMLDKTCEERFGLMIYLKVYPVFDNLRRITCDPHYRSAVEWVGSAWGHAVAPSTPSV
jgi:hypothetical protein